MWSTAVIAFLGVTALLYSPAASWVFEVNQTQVIERHDESLSSVDPSVEEQLAAARTYNEALSSGAILAANTRVPEGSGVTRDDSLDYWTLLKSDTGVMARIQIPRIGVDLPVFHGTSDRTLESGIGHLQGTSLPIGGESTHAVLTGHRGLAEATLFSDLDQLEVGDVFTVNTFGEVVTYRVVDTRVVEPEDNDALRQEAGRDLMTLVTCTPLGINSHRILVTGERVSPTPSDAAEEATQPARGPGFPWWLVAYVAVIALLVAYVWRAGRPHSARAPRSQRTGREV
ncbi:class C sortase [Microbacterium koreense]|uniref:Class C sortase n=1 Tax=Microbacterium koreense TaxID=323761 RepID=A0ABW2ZSI2_9MICO